jgi:predicted dehydrogenase
MIGDPVRIGILGCSDIARRKFIPALNGCAHAQLHAIARRDHGKGALLPLNCQMTSYEELLAAATVDLVYLSLPNHLHEEWSIKVLEAGKHLICEKPLSTSLLSAKKMLDCAAQNRRLIYENQMFLFHPQHALVKAMINAGRIGSLKALRSFFGFPFPHKGNFRLDPLQGGGAFHDLARYPLGIAVYLLSSMPQKFSGHATWRDGLNTGVAGTALTPANEIFTFSIAFGQHYEASYEVLGETGTIKVERAYTTPADCENRILLTLNGGVTEITVPPADHFQLMIDNICHIIRTGSDYALLNRQALTIAQLADRMHKGCLENSYGI